jgi:hypothetical protein
MHLPLMSCFSWHRKHLTVLLPSAVLPGCKEALEILVTGRQTRYASQFGRYSSLSCRLASRPDGIAAVHRRCQVAGKPQRLHFLYQPRMACLNVVRISTWSNRAA